MRVSENFTVQQVIVMLSITIVIVIVTLFSLDPLVQLRSARNQLRFAGLQTLGSALRTYEEENGSLPAMIDAMRDTVQIIGEGRGATFEECAAVECRGERVTPFGCLTPGLTASLQPFLGALPKDPIRGSSLNARYFINTSDHGAIILGACDEESEDLEGSALPPRIQVAW
ncbi:MAG: hypothetical protein AAB853_02275 [Patescibacteria group bacterium]